MELLRGVELRPGRNKINLFQPQNCEAALAYSRGQIIHDVQACRDCKRGRGPFVKCVVLRGYLKGSCSNCHYSAEGVRCSLRPREQQQALNDKIDTKSLNNISLDRKSGTAAKLFKRPLVEVSDESASESNMNEGMDQQYQTALKHKLKGGKVQKRAMRMRKLASLYKSIGDLLEEEADELIVTYCNDLT
jgi:Protein of unknown function (DUF3716)